MPKQSIPQIKKLAALATDESYDISINTNLHTDKHDNNNPNNLNDLYLLINPNPILEHAIKKQHILINKFEALNESSMNIIKNVYLMPT